MYSSDPIDYQKFSVSPPPSAPPYPFSQHAVTGIPVSSTNPYYEVKPQPAGLQARPITEVPWATGLCGCCSDVSNCCTTCCCPCITFGQISEIVDRGSSSCACNGAIYAALASLTGCGCCCYSCFYRSKMRRQYKLKEGPCGDCLLHSCCQCCALCQEYRQLKSLGFDMSIGWRGNVERQNGGLAMGPMVPVAPVDGMHR